MTMPAPTVSFVDSSIRMKAPIVRLRAYGSTACIEQTGLASEGLAAVEHPDEVLVRAAHSRGGDHRDVGSHAVDLSEVASHPARDRRRVELGLDGDAVRDDVQPAGESQHRCELGDPYARLRDLDSGQLFFHVSGQCHQVVQSVFRVVGVIRGRGRGA